MLNSVNVFILNIYLQQQALNICLSPYIYQSKTQKGKAHSNYEAIMKYSHIWTHLPVKYHLLCASKPLATSTLLLDCIYTLLTISRNILFLILQSWRCHNSSYYSASGSMNYTNNTRISACKYYGVALDPRLTV